MAKTECEKLKGSEERACREKSSADHEAAEAKLKPMK